MTVGELIEGLKRYNKDLKVAMLDTELGLTSSLDTHYLDLEEHYIYYCCSKKDGFRPNEVVVIQPK